MAIGDAYATKSELKGYQDHFSDAVDDTQLDEVLLQASRAVEHYCQRQFNKAAAATAKVYQPATWRRVTVDDFYDTAGLIIAVDNNDDGVYETTLTTSDYVLEPANGTVDGETGWPYYRILGVNWFTFPTCSQHPPVQVTAKWGWNAIPTGVKVATIYMALETFKLKGAPFGVASFDQFGPIRVRDNPKVMAMLAPYRLTPVLVG